MKIYYFKPKFALNMGLESLNFLIQAEVLKKAVHLETYSRFFYPSSDFPKIHRFLDYFVIVWQLFSGGQFHKRITKHSRVTEKKNKLFYNNKQFYIRTTYNKQSTMHLKFIRFLILFIMFAIEHHTYATEGPIPQLKVLQLYT